MEVIFFCDEKHFHELVTYTINNSEAVFRAVSLQNRGISYRIEVWSCSYAILQHYACNFVIGGQKTAECCDHMVAHLWGWRRAPGQGDSRLAHQRNGPSPPGWRSDRLVLPSRSPRWPWRHVDPPPPTSLFPCLPIPFEISLRGKGEMF
jgi:hypothetical protein